MKEIFERIEFRIIQLEHYSNILENIVQNLGKQNTKDYFINEVCWCLDDVMHAYPVIEIFTLIETGNKIETLKNLFLEIKKSHTEKQHEQVFITIESIFNNLHKVFTSSRCEYFAHKNSGKMRKKYTNTGTGGFEVKREEIIPFSEIKSAIAAIKKIYEALYNLYYGGRFPVWHGFGDDRIKSITFNIETK